MSFARGNEVGRQRDDHGFVFTGWETEIIARGFPTTVRVFYFEGQTARRSMRALGNSNVERTVGWINPTFANQDQWLLFRRVLRQLEFDPMIGTDALKPAERKVIRILAIGFSNCVEQIAIAFVACRRKCARRFSSD